MNATEMFKMVQCEHPLQRKTVFHKLFTEGCESLEDESGSGCPSASITEENIEKIRIKVMENRHITVRELAGDIDILISSVDVLVMKSLNFLQKQRPDEMMLLKRCFNE